MDCFRTHKAPQGRPRIHRYHSTSLKNKGQGCRTMSKVQGWDIGSGIVLVGSHGTSVFRIHPGRLKTTIVATATTTNVQPIHRFCWYKRVLSIQPSRDRKKAWIFLFDGAIPKRASVGATGKGCGRHCRRRQPKDHPSLASYQAFLGTKSRMGDSTTCWWFHR